MGRYHVGTFDIAQGSRSRALVDSSEPPTKDVHRKVPCMSGTDALNFVLSCGHAIRSGLRKYFEKNIYSIPSFEPTPFGGGYFVSVLRCSVSPLLF